MPPVRSRVRKRQTKISFSPAAKPSPQPRRVVSLSSDSDDDDDDDGLQSRPVKRRRIGGEISKGKKQGSTISPNSRGMFGSSDNEVVISSASSSEDDENEVEVVRVRSNKSSRQMKPVEVSDDDELAPKRSRHRKAQRRSSSEERGEDIIQPKSSRRRNARGISTPVGESPHEDSDDSGTNEDDELKEELAFLRSSPLPDRGRLRSTNATKPKNDRQKALDALKRKRAGTGEPSSSATPGRKKPVVVDSDSETDSGLEIIKEEPIGDADDSNDEDSNPNDESAEDDHATNALDVFQENVEDGTFIDDDNAMIGAPAEHMNIPLEFSSLSRAKPRELFKYAVEWMVQKKLNPAFSSDDEVYALTFKKLNDEVNALASSKFHSSVWTPEFTRAIRARPDFLVNEIGQHIRSIMDAHCEACNRKNHTATWEASLTGRPYNKDTLEPLADDSDSSGDNNSGSDSDSVLSSEADLNGEKPTYNANGERLPPESKFFTLGSTCKANAQVAHTLYHWRYHLNSWVVDYLVRQGHCTPEKLVKRDKWSVRKREKYANKIVDEMEKVGEIKKLHRLYKEQVDFALEARNDYQRGWGRTRG